MIVSAGQAVLGQFAQGAQCQPVQPLVKRQAVAGKTGQVLTPVAGHRRLALRAVQMGQEGRHIQGMIAGAVELHRGRDTRRYGAWWASAAPKT